MEFPDNHELLVFESIPYDAMGQNKIVFHRYAGRNYGLVTLDAAARTAAASFSHNGFEVSAAPGGRRVAYTNNTPFENQQRKTDIYVRELDAKAGVAVGGPGGGRGAPSWSPDGSRILFGETTGYSGVPFNRIVSVAATGSSREVLWEGASGEYADVPSQNSNGDLLFVFYPALAGGALEQRIARKTPTGPVEVIYTRSGPTWGLHQPVWSPSGLEVAFIENEIPSGPVAELALTLTVMAADGSNRRGFSLPQRWLAGTDISFCWGKDGTRLFLGLRESQTAAHIYSIRPDGTGFTSITTASDASDEWVSCA